MGLVAQCVVHGERRKSCSNRNVASGEKVPRKIEEEIALRLDCTLEMRHPRWAHFAGKGLQSEAKAILTEVPADGC